MKLQRVIAYLAILTVVVLGLGRVLELPVFLSLVASSSMTPTLQALDMVVAVKRNYSIGDIVVWCSTPMYCVIHRVVEAGGNRVVTMGDANPAPDPPVNPGLVKGVVVLTIPRLIWIPLLLLPPAIYAALKIYRKNYGGKPSAPRSFSGLAAAYTIVVFYAVFSSLLAFMSPLNPILFAELSIPSVEVVGVGFDCSEGLIVIAYSPRYLEIESIDGCRLLAANTSINCSTRILDSSVLVEVPSELLRWMNLEGVGKAMVWLNVSLSRNASLSTYLYPVHIVPLHPVVSVTEGVASIYNPNPFCFDANITIFWANDVGPWSTSKYLTCVEPKGSLEIDLRAYRYAYVRIEYVVSGRTLVVQREVMRDGWPAG